MSNGHNDRQRRRSRARRASQPKREGTRTLSPASAARSEPPATQVPAATNEPAALSTDSGARGTPPSAGAPTSLGARDEPFRGPFETVAQITAGILALLAGGVFTYLVFVNERRTQYDDNALELQFEIKQELLTLRSSGFIQTAPMLLPQGFIGRYQAAKPREKGPAIINQMLRDLMFQRDPMEKLLTESAPKAWPQGPIRGRAFMMAVNETVSLMTRRRGELTLDAPEAFPSVPLLGFQEWREDYGQLREAFSSIRFLRPALQADFEAALVSPLTEWQRRVIRENAISALTALDRAVTTIDTKLDAIDRVDIIRARYHAFEGVKGFIVPGLLLVAIAVVGGIALPLSVSLLPRLNTKRVAGVCIACGTIPSAVLVAGFLWYAWQLPETPIGAYAPKRWLAPLHGELESHAADLFYLRAVNQDRVRWTTEALDDGEVAPAIRVALGEYSRAIDLYTERRSALVEALAHAASETGLQQRLTSLAQPLQSGVSSGLSLLDRIVGSLVRERIGHVADTPNVSLSIDIEDNRSLNLPGAVVRSNRDALLQDFAKAQARTCETGDARAVEDAAETAHARLFDLARLLDPTTQIPEKVKGFRFSPTIQKLRLCSP